MVEVEEEEEVVAEVVLRVEPLNVQQMAGFFHWNYLRGFFFLISSFFFADCTVKRLRWLVPSLYRFFSSEGFFSALAETPKRLLLAVVAETRLLAEEEEEVEEGAIDFRLAE